MKRRTNGFTLIEILVVITIIAALAGLTTRMVLQAQWEKDKLVCTNNVRNLTGLLENTGGARFPDYSGPNLLLYLVKKKHIVGEDELQELFCPGDLEESLVQAGGVAVYDDLDLARTGEFGALTSYAARAQAESGCRVKRHTRNTVLVADDSEDHHDDRGIVVGLSGGAVRWRAREDVPLLVGELTEVEELRCLRAE